MLLSALAKGRCRGSDDEIREIFVRHLLPGGDPSGVGSRSSSWNTVPMLMKGEVQNVALAVHAATKLDVHALPLDPERPQLTAMSAVAPAVEATCAESLRGPRGAQSLALLAHAFGVALVVAPKGAHHSISEDPLAACERALLALFACCESLPVQGMKQRFQLLSALQCWWCAGGGPGATLEMLRAANKTLRICGMPGVDEAHEGQDWVTTKDHLEVAGALPPAVRPRAVNEQFAFPFWVDVVVMPES